MTTGDGSGDPLGRYRAAVARTDALIEGAQSPGGKSPGEIRARAEQRLSRIDLQATAASGNAARAEGLLIAFAARRMIDKGEPLGFLEERGSRTVLTRRGKLMADAVAEAFV